MYLLYKARISESLIFLQFWSNFDNTNIISATTSWSLYDSTIKVLVQNITERSVHIIIMFTIPMSAITFTLHSRILYIPMQNFIVESTLFYVSIWLVQPWNGCLSQPWNTSRVYRFRWARTKTWAYQPPLWLGYPYPPESCFLLGQLMIQDLMVVLYPPRGPLTLTIPWANTTPRPFTQCFQASQVVYISSITGSWAEMLNWNAYILLPTAFTNLY